MVEIVRCNVCELDVYVNDSLFVGKDKVPIEVEIHMNKPEHKNKQQVLNDSIPLVKDGCESAFQHWERS